MSPTCKICNDTNLVVVVEDGKQFARECECVPAKRLDGQLRRALLPERYRKITIADYETKNVDASLRAAAHKAKRYVEEYLPGQPNRGLLFVGDVGVGKTHLAVAILRELVTKKGVTGSFYDFRELLTKVKTTYQPGSAVGELAVLGPVMSAELVVLDELGAAKLTDWVFDIIEHVINARYNDGKTTIITTNYSNAVAEPSGNEYARALTQETLRDRIGARMHSRLQQMCDVVEMHGQDWRARRGK